ncbi:MAG: sugar kinase [Fusobacteriaceae bacterium]|jgi:2-dehydro-3-deoxygluconokinase|nr:sugar kinase [Fusobacteriaceae bacterium]
MEKIITFGEIMLRLTPPEYNKIDQTNTFMANYGGGEANVAVSLSHFGHKTYFMSKLPPNILGDAAIQHLRGYGVNTDYVVRGSTTLGIYFLETGFGGRPSKVIYNRKHSAITRIEKEEFNFEEIFSDATWFHVSGISLALGEQVREVLMECLEYCQKYNVTVSFDFNYRSKLWTIEEASESYKNVIPYVDVVFSSYFDCNTILGIEANESIKNLMEKRVDLFRKVIKKYDIKYIFGTDRIVYSATENSLAGYCISETIEKYTDPIRFNIYDRIGGGDAFASGIIHGLIKDFDAPDYALDFGLVTSVLKHTIYGDVCVLKCEDILDYMQNAGNKGVDR